MRHIYYRIRVHGILYLLRMAHLQDSCIIQLLLLLLYYALDVLISHLL